MAEPDTSYLAGEIPATTLDLTLDQAQQLAAEHNPSARAALAALRTARGARMREAGAFDPVLYGASEQINVDTPVTSPFEASQLRTRAVSGGVTWVSPIGTFLDLALLRVSNETNAPFSTLPTERRANARLGFVQPILNGFGPASTRGQLRAADREVEAASEALRAATLDLNAQVETSYWDLYAAEQRLAVQRLLRQRAAVFLRDQVLRGRSGVVGPGSISTARAFLAEQESALLDARIRAAASSDLLGEVIGMRPVGAERYRPLDEPPAPAAVEPLDLVLARALAHDPSLRQSRADSAAARAREREAAWNAWPTVEAFGGYGAAGLGGVGRQIVFGTDTLGTAFDHDFGYAWDQVSARDYPQWNFGVRVVMPIGWRPERGERERQRGLYEQAVESLRARQLSVESAVRAAYHVSALGQAELDAARMQVESAAEQARIAGIEFQAGRRTAYDLVNIEADLAAARLRETVVRVTVARAAAELRRRTTPAPGRTR